ncbi:MAG TPA: cupredoxin domain-containing protein [Longimicrobium sp.]|jgi:plastocyanin domain-containing protein
MDASEWAVIFGGAAVIAWVNWYFFVAGRSPAHAAVGAVAGGRQEVTVVVQGGYSPAHVRVKAGAPVRLLFDRQETSGCSEEVVIPDFGIRRFLPANHQTPVEFTPERAGSYEFTCGMGMLRGRITVDEQEG